MRMENKVVIFVLGVLLGVVLSQYSSSRCGDGMCWCSESTKIISCVDSSLGRIPSFGSHIRKWVKRLNLRFNFIIDLSRLLHSEFPKLQIVDVRNNPPYLCNEIHHVLVAKGLIIESDCPGETTMVIRTVRTSPVSSTTPRGLPPKPTETPTTRSPITPRASTKGHIDWTIQMEETTAENEDFEGTTEVMKKLDVTGKITCDMSFQVSIAAVASSIVTSILSFFVHYFCKRCRRSTDNVNISNKFSQPRPRGSTPRIQLFQDLSQPSSSSSPIYTGKQNFVNNDNYEIDSATDSDREGHYEAPINIAKRTPSAPPSPPSCPPPPPPPQPKASSVGGASAKVKGRGKGRGISTVSSPVNDPPANNTRSRQLKTGRPNAIYKNTVYTSHM